MCVSLSSVLLRFIYDLQDIGIDAGVTAVEPLDGSPVPFLNGDDELFVATVALYGCGLLGLCGLVRCHEYYSIGSVGQ